MLLEAIAAGHVHAGDFTIPAPSVQPASLDLRLGEVAYRIRCSFLPDRETVERRVKDYIIDELDLRKRRRGARDQPALPHPAEGAAVAAAEHARARPTRRARPAASTCSRGSSPTRATASTRSPPATTGQLYLEVVPLSFPVRVREDLSLNQLRLVGRAGASLTDDDVRALPQRRAAAVRPRRAGARSTSSRSAAGCSSASTCTATPTAASATAAREQRAAARHDAERGAPVDPRRSGSR